MSERLLSPDPALDSRGAAPVLTIDGLSRRFGDRTIVTSLDLQAGAGERIALRGPNGTGKTTVLRCVGGTLNPTSGTVEVLGHAADSVEARRLVGVSLSQERSFYLRLSGYANLMFFARLRHASKRRAEADVRALVEELEIEEIAAKRADRCSTGMLQQLALARALLGEPALLALDEPTRSLDAGAIERLWAALDRRPDTAVLFATHREEDLERCHRRVDFPI